MDVLAIIERVKAGDQDAKAELVQQFKPLLYRLGKSFELNGNLDDLFQLGVIELLKAAQDFDPERRVKPITVFYKYISNRLLREREQVSARASRHSSLDAFDEFADRKIEDLREDIEILRGFLKQIKSSEWTVLVQRAEGVKLHEVARMMNIAKERARQLERSGLEKLRVLFNGGRAFAGGKVYCPKCNSMLKTYKESRDHSRSRCYGLSVSLAKVRGKSR